MTVYTKLFTPSNDVPRLVATVRFGRRPANAPPLTFRKMTLLPTVQFNAPIDEWVNGKSIPLPIHPNKESLSMQTTAHVQSSQ